MRATKKTVLLTALTAAATVALAACAPTASGQTEPSGGGEISVGVISSETGPLAGYGDCGCACWG